MLDERDSLPQPQQVLPIDEPPSLSSPSPSSSDARPPPSLSPTSPSASDASAPPLMDYHRPTATSRQRTSRVVVAGICLAAAASMLCVAVFMIYVSVRVQGGVCALAWPVVFCLVCSALLMRYGVRLLNASK